jgi:hypothetical protein
VKISKLPSALLVSLLLSATVVAADSEYPATDFQPTIVYQDKDYKHSGGDSGTSKSASKAKASGEVSAPDSKYPAANFQPEVLFEDSGYKHTKGEAKPYSSSKLEVASSTESQSQSTESESSSESAEDTSLALGLGILAIAGFLFYKRSAGTSESNKPVKKKVRAKKAGKNNSATVSSDGGPASGVAKYLENKVGPEPSGVAKYLEENTGAASGVAKYVAQKKVSARTTRIATVTGVEKYLKKQG